MNITPAEIREKRFKTKVMGYNTNEVDAFMSMLADWFEELLKEVVKLRDEVKRLDADLELYKGREESIKKTMMTAHKVYEDTKKNAEREGQIIMQEAELRAEKFLGEANQRLMQTENEILEIKRQKVKFEESLRSLLATHYKLLGITKENKAVASGE